MAEIRIPPVLRGEAAGSRTVVVEATNVRGALAALIAQHPALEARVLPNGDVPTFLNVFVDGEDIRLLGGLDAPLHGNSKVLLLPAVAGGSEPGSFEPGSFLTWFHEFRTAAGSSKLINLV